MSAWPGDLVGERVVLRRRAGVRDGRVVYSDVLGELVAISDTFLWVRLENGSTVTVAQDDVHRLRPVPPGRADILALEAVAARGWPAPDTAWLGRWLLRAGGGWTRRANSALLLGDPDRPVPDALAEVRAWYAERGLPALLALPLPAQAPADHAAARLGWVADIDAEVLTAPVTPGPADPEVLLSPTLTPDWEAAYRARGVPPVGRWILTAPGYSGAGVPQSYSGAGVPQRHSGAGVPQSDSGAGVPQSDSGAGVPQNTVTFASLVMAGTTAAIGRGVVLDGWLGVAAVEVLPGYRRQGFARRVMAALTGWGAGQGAGRCYVQVDAANAPALALYAGLGFTRHHRYRIRKLPAGIREA